MSIRIALVSGHHANWNAGASSVLLHLHAQLNASGEDVTLYHAEDYEPRHMPSNLHRHLMASSLARRLFDRLRKADVVEIAGNYGWRAFERLRAIENDHRPLLVCRIHGLEFKDEQARIDEEIARVIRLPRKYKTLTRHWINYQEQRTIKAADVVFCYTSRDTDAIIAAGWKDEKDVITIPPGVEESFVSDRQYPERAVRLLWWGSWSERKGTAYLPRAFELALRENPDLTLTIGGASVPESHVLCDFPLALRKLVQVLPFVSTVEHKRILLDHDIFVFPSLSEGFGLALLEALASGMPAITTFTGIAYDWLEHDRNCLLVPMAAPTAFSKAITVLVSDRSRRERLGYEGRQTAQHLTWKLAARCTLDAYKEHLRFRGALVD